MTDQEFFFRYDKDITGMTKFSNLSLLRRDINTCFGKNPNNTSSTIDYIAIWPGTMAILAGIDLLAKFYCGDDNYKKSTERFVAFIEEFIDKEHKEELFQLRNSLLHSFGLHSEGRHSQQYKFVLTRSPDYLVKRKDSSDKYCISVTKLHEIFEQSIIKFQTVYHSLDSVKEFDRLYSKYGFTEIGNNPC